MPAVSVIIPIFNMERFLPECLDSVLKQSLSDIEVICVNDGSTDSSREILDRYAALDQRIVPVHQENQGVYAARNNALRLAAGEYAAFMDPDDYYPHSQALETLHRAATSNRAAICGGSLVEYVNGRTRPVPDRTFREEKQVDYRDYQCEYGFQCFIFSMRLLRENALEFPPYTRFQDPPFLIAAMLKAKTFYAIPQEVYCYRWGHQQAVWSERKICDLVRGLRDNLRLARENDLRRLHANTVNRFKKDFFQHIMKHTGNPELLGLLLEAEAEARLDDAGGNSPILEPLKCIQASATQIEILTRQLEDLKRVNHSLSGELEAMRNSFSFRAGRAITWLPRRLRDSGKKHVDANNTNK